MESGELATDVKQRAFVSSARAEHGPEAQPSTQDSVPSASSTPSPPKHRAASLRALHSASSALCAEIPAPSGVKRGSAALHGDQCYVAASESHNVYAYRLQEGSWTEAPNYPYTDFQLAVVGGYLTGIGGRMQDEAYSPSSELYSLIDGEWKPHFPPMTTARSEAAVVSCGESLVVIGGVEDGTLDNRTLVEIMSTATLKWTASCPLPERLEFPSAAFCGDDVYVVEGDGHTVYTSPLNLLVSWTPDTGDVWTKVAPVPTRWSTAASLGGQLLALGGWEDDEEPTSDVHVFVPENECWCKIGKLAEPRDLVIAAPLADNRALVVGGSRTTSEDSCVVEILSVA